MKIFLSSNIFHEKYNGFFRADNIVENLGGEYTYFLLPSKDYYNLITYLIGAKINITSGQTEEKYPFFNYYGYIFQWIPKNKVDNFKLLK